MTTFRKTGKMMYDIIDESGEKIGVANGYRSTYGDWVVRLYGGHRGSANTRKLALVSAMRSKAAK